MHRRFDPKQLSRSSAATTTVMLTELVHCDITHASAWGNIKLVVSPGIQPSITDISTGGTADRRIAAYLCYGLSPGRQILREGWCKPRAVLLWP